MTQIKSLKHASFDALYKAFHEAFIDYEVQINKKELANMLKRRGYVPELSFGAFDENKLVAFTFNGIGSYNNIKTAYDTGTGTIPAYRGQGLAGKIFSHSIPFLQAAGIKQYLLEVLQNNTTAVSLYKKQGFTISREFFYYVDSIEQLKRESPKANKNLTIHILPKFPDALLKKTWDFNPSWQNSNDAIQRDIEKFIGLAAYYNNSMVGYLIFEPMSGDITQLGTLPEHRRKGIAKQLLNFAIENHYLKKLKILNIETNCSTLNSFLHSLGCSPLGKQYEMIKSL